MRTTLTIDDEKLDQCRDLADQQGISLGDAVGLLIRRRLAYRSPCGERNGFAVFHGAGTPHRFGLDDIKKALADEDLAGAGNHCQGKTV